MKQKAKKPEKKRDTIIRPVLNNLAKFGNKDAVILKAAKQYKDRTLAIEIIQLHCPKCDGAKLKEVYLGRYTEWDGRRMDFRTEKWKCNDCNHSFLTKEAPKYNYGLMMNEKGLEVYNGTVGTVKMSLYAQTFLDIVGGRIDTRWAWTEGYIEFDGKTWTKDALILLDIFERFAYIVRYFGG